MKRIRKYIFGGIVGGLLIFILPGLLTKEVTFTTDTSIKKPLSSVYITMGDPARLSGWMSGFEKIEHVQGMPFCEGSKYLMTIDHHGKKIRVLEEIVKITWKKRLKMKMSLDHAEMLADLFFFQIDDETIIKGTYTVQGKSLWMRILLPWIKPGIRRSIEEQLDDFREMMEKKAA